MRCWTTSFLLYCICKRRKFQPSLMLTSASWWKSCVYFSTVIFKLFCPLNRDSRSLEEVWETCKNIFGSRPEATCAVRSNELSHTIYISLQQGKGNSSLLLMQFSLSEAELQNYHGSPGISKDVPVSSFLKDKPFRKHNSLFMGSGHSH